MWEIYDIVRWKNRYLERILSTAMKGELFIISTKRGWTMKNAQPKRVSKICQIQQVRIPKRTIDKCEQSNWKM